MALYTSQASSKTWMLLQSSKTSKLIDHKVIPVTNETCIELTCVSLLFALTGLLTHWEITRRSTCSITEAEYSSALRSRSPPLQAPRPCPPTPCGYASWKTFIETGLLWAALPAFILFFFLKFVSSSVGRENKHIFLSLCICEYAVQTRISCG